jgi:hypothetical protein
MVLTNRGNAGMWVVRLAMSVSVLRAATDTIVVNHAIRPV